MMMPPMLRFRFRFRNSHFTTIKISKTPILQSQRERPSLRPCLNNHYHYHGIKVRHYALFNPNPSDHSNPYYSNPYYSNPNHSSPTPNPYYNYNVIDEEDDDEKDAPDDDDENMNLNEFHQIQVQSDNKPSDNPHFWLHIWSLVENDFFLLLSITATTLCSALVHIRIPLVMGSIVSLIQTHDMAALPTASLKLLSLIASGGLLSFIDIYLVSLLGERVAGRIRVRLYASLLEKPVAFFDSVMSSELLGGDVSEFKHAFKQTLTTGLKALIQSLGSIYALIGLSPSLSLTLASTAPALYLLMNSYGAFLRDLSRDAKMCESRALDGAGECLGTVKTVKSFTATEYQVDKFTDAINQSSSASTKLGFHIGVFQGLQSLFVGSMVLCVLYMGGMQVSEGQMSGGDLLSFLVALQNTQKSMTSLGIFVGTSNKAAAAACRVFEYMDPVSSTPAPPALTTLPSHSTDIIFDKVGFSYPTRPHQPVLSDFSLRIPQGAMVAVCGASGSGKTTLANLLTRFYDLTSGRILFGDTDITHVQPEAVRARVGYIQQDPGLFNASVGENIAYGRRGATKDEIEAAARAANCHDFVMMFREGYDTVVGERGTSLSGGQKQRIAIARALLKNPEILVLDEATSALDSTSEAVVQEALEECTKGRTVLVIAHRLSTIKKADLILVLGQKGRILEQGNHEELMRRRGVYYTMYNAKK